MPSSNAALKSGIPFPVARPLVNRKASSHGRWKKLVDVFSTCPQSNGAESDSYAHHVREAARWSELCGCKGILVYRDNSIVDPWLVSQIIVESTEKLIPLVAIQPIYMHPYTVAKMLSSFAFLHHRRLYLNMVAGGFKNDLVALNDTTPHDKRYARLIEYTTIIKELLASSADGSPNKDPGPPRRVTGS